MSWRELEVEGGRRERRGAEDGSRRFLCLALQQALPLAWSRRLLSPLTLTR
jgi:hypothetical protein